MSLSCYDCANPVATATHPSDGCVADVQITVSYGTSLSAPFNVTIVTPNQSTVQSGYPTHAIWPGYPTTGYISTFSWNVIDSCGYSDAGLDGHEYFGTFSNDYFGNNWGHPGANGIYNASSIWFDQVGAHSYTTPATQNPQAPLGSTKVFNDYPWQLLMGTQVLGTSGANVRSDTQQFYQDHGLHY